MAYQITPFMVLNLVVFTLTTGLACYALYLYLNRTRRRLLLALAGFMLSISGWECTEFFKYASSSADFKLLLENVENAVPAALFLYFLLWFTLEYTDNQQWTILDRTIPPQFRGYQLFAYAVHFIGGGIVIRYILKNKTHLYFGQAVALLLGFVPQIAFNSAIFMGILAPKWNITAILLQTGNRGV